MLKNNGQYQRHIKCARIYRNQVDFELSIINVGILAPKELEYEHHSNRLEQYSPKELFAI
jgi:hypothetical protein